MCLTGAVFMNVRRQLECLHFVALHSSVSDPPSKLLRCVTPSTCLLQLLMLLQSFLDRQRYPTLLAIFRPSITSHLRKFYPLHFIFFFFFNFSEPMHSADGAIFFHMKFRFSILWKNDIGVFWDEFPSNNGFNTKHLSIVAKKKAKGSNMHFADSAKQGNVCLCFRGNKLMCFVCICTHLSRTHGYTKHSCCVITNTFVRPFSVSPYGFI